VAAGGEARAASGRARAADDHRSIRLSQGHPSPGGALSCDTLIKAGFQYNEYDVPNASPGASPSYGAAYHTPDYIRAHWSRVFTVLDVQEGAIDDLNDLVVLQKT
jgi:hypothetical protein